MLMAALMCVANYFVCRTSSWGAPGSNSVPIYELLKATWEAHYGLGAPAVILGGIYSGAFTPTEAAAVAVAYCLIVELFLTRGLTWKDVPKLLVRSGAISGIIGPVIAFSVLLAEVLAVLRIPDRLAGYLLSIPSGYVTGVLMIYFVLFVLGCFLETIAALIIMMPILLPIGTSLGFDPVHLGVYVVCALTVGFITPPVGINLFAASAVSGVPYLTIASRTWPVSSVNAGGRNYWLRALAILVVPMKGSVRRLQDCGAESRSYSSCRTMKTAVALRHVCLRISGISNRS